MNLERKYARFILKDCLKVRNGQPVIVIGNTLNQVFMEIMREEAISLGSNDVYLLIEDKYAQRELLLNASLEECLESPLFDRHVYNEYALKGAAFARVTSQIPHIYDGVDTTKLSNVNKFLQESISVFREKQQSGEIPWCIFAVSNEEWANEIMSGENRNQKLQDLIYDICWMKEENPIVKWNDYFEKLDDYCRILNDMNIESLHYTNSLGTDIVFELPENYRFVSGKEGDYIVNMPSLEMFTTPKKHGVNGIVKSSKPLIYSGIEIKDFSLTVRDGKIIEVHANEGEEVLKEMIETDEGAHYFGEIALIDYDSKINQSGIIFKETLYDENASCHVAIGEGFSECIKDGLRKSKEELEFLGINQSLVHTDFMIGTRDLKIEATLKNGSKKMIMENGTIVLGGRK